MLTTVLLLYHLLFYIPEMWKLPCSSEESAVLWFKNAARGSFEITLLIKQLSLWWDCFTKCFSKVRNDQRQLGREILQVLRMEIKSPWKLGNWSVCWGGSCDMIKAKEQLLNDPCCKSVSSRSKFVILTSLHKLVEHGGKIISWSVTADSHSHQSHSDKSKRWSLIIWQALRLSLPYSHAVYSCRAHAALIF